MALTFKNSTNDRLSTIASRVKNAVSSLTNKATTSTTTSSNTGLSTGSSAGTKINLSNLNNSSSNTTSTKLGNTNITNNTNNVKSNSLVGTKIDTSKLTNNVTNTTPTQIGTYKTYKDEVDELQKDLTSGNFSGNTVQFTPTGVKYLDSTNNLKQANTYDDIKLTPQTLNALDTVNKANNTTLAKATVNAALNNVKAGPAKFGNFIADRIKLTNENEPSGLRQLNNRVIAEAEKSQAVKDYLADTPAKTIISGGAQLLLEALPDAILAYLTAGQTLNASLATKNTTLVPMLGEVVKELGSKTTFWTSFVRTAGDTYYDQLEKGATEQQAALAAYTNGVLGGAIEVGSGIEKLPTAKSSNVKALLSSIKKVAAEEAAEEVQQYSVEGLANMAFGQRDENGNLLANQFENYVSLDPNKQAVINPIAQAQQAAAGALVGGIIGGAGIGLNNIRSNYSNATPYQSMMENTDGTAIPMYNEKASPEGNIFIGKLRESTGFSNPAVVNELSTLYNEIPEIVDAKVKTAQNTSTSTKKTYTLEDGKTYTPERQVAHNQWVQQGMNYGSAVTDASGKTTYTGEVAQGKRADIVIGLPSSGKSSAVVDPISSEYKSRLIDSDEFKKMIPEYNNGNNSTGVHKESQDLAAMTLNQSIENGDNVVIPIVGSDPIKIVKKYINGLNDAGYSVHVIYNYLPENIAAERNFNRFLDTGRLVDLDETSFEYANKVDNSYEVMKVLYEEGFIDGYSKYSNNVPYGQKPIFIESSETNIGNDNEGLRGRGNGISRYSLQGKSEIQSEENGSSGRNKWTQNLSSNRGGKNNVLPTRTGTLRGERQSGDSKVNANNQTGKERLGNDGGHAQLLRQLDTSDYQTYSTKLAEAKKKMKYGAFVSAQSVDSLNKQGAKTFLTSDGESGVAVTNNGNIIGVFNSSDTRSGMVKDLMLKAISEGGKFLDVYGEKNANKYHIFGNMKPLFRVEFDADAVDEDADALLLAARPTTYFMILDDDADTSIDKINNETNQHITQEEFDALPTLTYDEAANLSEQAAKEKFGKTATNASESYEELYNQIVAYDDADAKLKLLDKAKADVGNSKIGNKQINTLTANDLDMPTVEKILDKVVQKSLPTKSSTKTLPTANNGVKLKPNGADTNDARTKLKTSQSRRNAETGEGYKYEATTHEQRESIAAADIKQNGSSDEYTYLKGKDSWTDVDTVKAKQLIEGTDLTNVQRKNLAEKIREQASLAGQTLEAQKHFYENTLTGKLVKASKTVNKAVEDIKAKNPKAVESAKAESNKYTSTIEAAAKKSKTKAEFIENVRQKLEKSEAPKTKTEQYTRDKVMNIVNNIENFEDTASLEDTIDEVNNIIMASKNIPVLTSQDVNEIKKNMELAESSDGYMARMYRARADQIISDAATVTLKQKFKSIQRMALLSNPKTLITRNAGGNLGLSLVENVKDIPAAGVDAIVSLFTKERYKTLPFSFYVDDDGKVNVDASKVGAQFTGLAKGVIDEFKDIKYGVDTGPSGRYMENSSNMTTWNAKNSKTKAGKVANKTMNFFDKLIGYSLKFGDRPFYEAAYQSKTKELELLRKRGKLDITDAEIEEKAKQHGLDMTFQSDSKLYQFGSSLRNAINKVTGGIGGDLIIPFTMTPANIMDKLVDYSPLGLAKAGFELGKTKKGTFDQAKFSNTLGRAFTGMGLIMIGYILRKKELLNGNAYEEADNYDEYRALQAQGTQSYSLKVGSDKTVTIDWLDPTGSMMIIGADFADAFGTADELKGIMNTILKSSASAVDGVFDRGFLSGFLDLTENINDYGVVEGLAYTLIDQIGSQTVPNAVKSINRVIDKNKRETYDANVLKKQLNVIKSGIPFVSKTLPEKKLVTGETAENYQGRGIASKLYESLLAPYNKSVTQNDTVNDECIRLYKLTGNTNTLLQSADKTFSFNGTKYTVETAEQLSKMQADIGEYAGDRILELMDTSDYKLADSAKKADMIADINKEAITYGRKQFLIENGKLSETDYEFGALDSQVQKKYADTKMSKSEFTTAYNNQKELDTTTSKAMSLVKDGVSYENASTINKSITETSYKKAQKLVSLGVTPEKYDELRDKADLNDNGSVTKKEAHTVLLQDTSLTKEQKMYLQAYLSNTKL